MIEARTCTIQPTGYNWSISEIYRQLTYTIFIVVKITNFC